MTSASGLQVASRSGSCPTSCSGTCSGSVEILLAGVSLPVISGNIFNSAAASLLASRGPGGVATAGGRRVIGGGARREGVRAHQ